jgi:sister-chromatid-cohesion protein PDS5
MEQENVDLKALVPLKRELVAEQLLFHKDKGVKILTACCLADILRLFAPNAPYTENELREIFEFFVKQMMTISEPNNPYFNKSYYLLESLSTVKSIVLLTDLNADDLFVRVFKSFFKIIKYLPLSAI